MGIVDEDIGRVRDASDIVAVISQYTQLRRVGRRYQGLCPFHAEKSPSFSVNAEEGLYYCFGCQVRGDVITFVREKEQQDFVGAVEWLANKAGVQLRYTDAGQGEERKRKAKLQDAVSRAVDWYHDRLLTADDAGAARGYLRQRGFDGEMVRKYRIGWAPDAWDALAKSLRLSNQDLTDAGLGFVNRRGRQQDAFRNRVLFPVFDAQGAAVGFGGRILPGGDGPKYKNSSESSVYAKSRVLYALNWSKTDIVANDEVVVCEGYTDVTGMASAGIERAVATCGTALTEDHVKLLRRFARRVVLAFDADAAGQNAAARFYEWERAHDLDVAVADLPPGVDPGDLSRDDPARLVTAVEEARPFLEFRVERILRAGDFDSVEGRVRVGEEALAAIREHPNPEVRDSYAMMVASRCRLDEGRIRALAAQAAPLDGAEVAASAGSGGRRSNGRAATAVLDESPEIEALKLAVHRRDEIQSLLVAELFVDDLCATVYDLLGRNDSLHEVIGAGGPEVAELVQRLSVEDSPADPVDVAAQLWRPYLERLVAESRSDTKARMAAASPDEQIEIMRNANLEQTWLLAMLERIREPAQQAGAIADLLVWVGDLAEDSM
ncbi:MAG: DNA primase [Actinomycetota bacterium]